MSQARIRARFRDEDTVEQSDYLDVLNGIDAQADALLPTSASAAAAGPSSADIAVGANAAGAGSAGAVVHSVALTRLFLDPGIMTPLGKILTFHSAEAVADYYGSGSEQANLAKEFFSGYGSSATMLFTRYPIAGTRAILYGANISNMTLQQLRNVSGTLSITVDGASYSASINLSGVTSFKAAAKLIETALNQNLPQEAVTTGSSITPVSVSFNASISAALMTVTSVSSGQIEVGSFVTGPGVPAGTKINSQMTGTPGGPGLYNLFVPEGKISSETMTDSYGILTVGSASGTVGVNQEVTGAGIAPLTAIESNLSGSGAGSTWIVNNAQSMGSENMTMTGPPVNVNYPNGLDTPLTGATAKSFIVNQNGDFLNLDASNLSYMGGTAATALGLTQASGAYDAPGGMSTSASAFMNNVVQNETNKFSSFQSIWAALANDAPQTQTALADWVQSTGGKYTFLTNYTNTTPPAGVGPTTQYPFNRLFLTDAEQMPFGEVLPFNSYDGVANFFGVSSHEAKLAKTYFSDMSAVPAEMLFARYAYGGGRARLFSGNLGKLASLQSINGNLSITSNGYTFSGHVNLAGVQSYSAAATAIQTSLDANVPVAGTITGSSIAPVNLSFTGSVDQSVLTVTNISQGSIGIGSYLSVPGINSKTLQVVEQISGTPNGVGKYAIRNPSGNQSAPLESMKDSYGILTVGAVTSGTVAAGQYISANGVAPFTAIQSNISGSGMGSTWVVSAAQTVASENMTTTAAPLDVSYVPVTGATKNSRTFWIEEDGHTDVVGSTMSYATGTAARALGLTQKAGAILSGPGQVVTSPSQFMTNLVNNYFNEFGSFVTTFSPAQEAVAALQAWAQASNGLYAYVPPTSGSAPVTLAGNLNSAGSSSESAGDTFVLSGGHLLLLDSTVAAGQTVSFTGSGGTLDLSAPQGFAGKISGFDTVGANDTIEVAAPWVFSGFTENAGGTQGSLRFANGASTLSLTLLGNYNPADFVHQTQANGSTLIIYTSALNGVFGSDSLLPTVSGAATHAGEFGIREASGSARGDWGVGASWDGSVGHAPGPS
jgi:Protein of unknown function (DUF3383)